MLGGRLADDERWGDFETSRYLVNRDTNNSVINFFPGNIFDVRYHSESEIYSGELNQIVQIDRHTVVAGARCQSGTFHTQDQVLISATSSNFSDAFLDPPAASDLDADFERASAYAYWTWEIHPRLLITPGLSYDWLRFPRNDQNPPISPGEGDVKRLSPKAALVWNPVPDVTVRGVYARSLGGASLEESFRLEPAQLAGFSQGFRTTMPASLGPVSAPEFEIAGLGLDLKFNTRTYINVQGELVQSSVRREIGVFQGPEVLSLAKMSIGPLRCVRIWTIASHPSQPRSTSCFPTSGPSGCATNMPGPSLTGNCRRSQLILRVPSSSTPAIFTNFTSPCSTTILPAGSPVASWAGSYKAAIIRRLLLMAGDHALPHRRVPQLNLLVGYRFRHQRGEIAVGGLNLTGEDYRLNPINYYLELPRERVFYTRLRLRF